MGKESESKQRHEARRASKQRKLPGREKRATSSGICDPRWESEVQSWFWCWLDLFWPWHFLHLWTREGMKDTFFYFENQINVAATHWARFLLGSSSINFEKKERKKGKRFQEMDLGSWQCTPPHLTWFAHAAVPAPYSFSMLFHHQRNFKTVKYQRIISHIKIRSHFQKHDIKQINLKC